MHHLFQMDLGTYLKEKGRLDAERTLSYALDIARYCKIPVLDLLEYDALQ